MQRPEPCPACGTTRRNKQDVVHGYCGRCHWYTFDPAALAMWRESWPEKAAEAEAYRHLVQLGQAR